MNTTRYPRRKPPQRPQRAADWRDRYAPRAKALLRAMKRIEREVERGKTTHAAVLTVQRSLRSSRSVALCSWSQLWRHFRCWKDAGRPDSHVFFIPAYSNGRKLPSVRDRTAFALALAQRVLGRPESLSLKAVLEEMRTDFRHGDKPRGLENRRTFPSATSCRRCFTPYQRQALASLFSARREALNAFGLKNSTHPTETK